MHNLVDFLITYVHYHCIIFNMSTGSLSLHKLMFYSTFFHGFDVLLINL